ncbi:SPFH domain-containing protein [Corallococcus sicarius]|nr:SPFH domain-containing protein [Corallococcus sicarius]
MSANAKSQARSQGSDAGSEGTGRPALVRLEGGLDRSRYTDGWRAGKPAEDPDKVKGWGLITARPSEFLIHMRRGRLREVSGQGASCFKLPGDSVAIVPTSIQRLQFTADQVTSEKVGVAVTGLAVYRIADPLVAFRMLNFSYPERAQEKLAELLREMFVGAARRLVANLSVEECLTRRKEGIAEELMREIAPVLAGQGQLADRTDKGWGVLLDTIEIQDVRVLSATVFEHMQARFRREQERQAREAELAKERFVRREETEGERVLNLQRLAAQEEVRQRSQATEEQARLEQLAVEARLAATKLEQERQAQQEKTAVAREVALAKLAAQEEVSIQTQALEEKARLEALAAKGRLEEAQLAAERQLALNRAQGELERLRLEHQAESAKAQVGLERLRRQQQAEAARHELQLAESRQEAEQLAARLQVLLAKQSIAEAEASITELELRRTRSQQALEMERARELREIENTVSPEVIQLTLARQLPQVAAAFQQKMGEVHVTAVDGANPFGYIAAAVEGVMGLARSAGLKVPGNPQVMPVE